MQAAADIAAAALRVGASEVLSVERIKHGLTNETWLVRTRADAVVVRISNPREQPLQIDRASEAAILAAVAAAGIGADVLACDPNRRILVTRYLGAPWTRDDAVQPANIRRMAALLHELHGLAVPAGAREVDLAGSVDGYLATLAAQAKQSDLIAPARRERAHAIAQTLRMDAEPCLCHNDVHHLNVIEAGELRLIDWEYAGIGARWFDLASVCVYHGYDEAQRDLLLGAYEPQFDAVARERLQLACWLFDYVRELWLTVRELSSEQR
jgi:thiamine kinase